MMRIVVTGYGACTSVGDTADACFDAFTAGTSGAAPLKHLDAPHFNARTAYERDETGTKGRFRSSAFLRRALIDAVAMAGIDQDTETAAVYVGTGLRELRSAELALLAGEQMDVSELDFTAAVRGVLPKSRRVHTLSNACAASNYALALATDAIRAGRCDIAIAAGCDTLTASMFGLLDRVNPDVPEAVQVFDQNRKGVLMGDGGVALIVESLDSALAAGRKPLAEIRAVGLSTDAVHETAPDMTGIRRAVDDAFSRADLSPEQVDLIYVHGTGTSLNDATESAVLADVYVASETKPALSGLKAMTGHTSGASGAIGVVAAIKSLKTGLVPPTPGTDTPVPEADGFALSETCASREIDLVQVNAFGFGGVNSVVLVSDIEEMAHAAE